MRVNEKYLQEMCVNLTQKEMIEYDIFKAIDDENRKVYLDTIKRAIETEEEQECETWRSFCTNLCGEEQVHIRSTIRLIGKS